MVHSCSTKHSLKYNLLVLVTAVGLAQPRELVSHGALSRLPKGSEEVPRTAAPSPCKHEENPPVASGRGGAREARLPGGMDSGRGGECEGRAVRVGDVRKRPRWRVQGMQCCCYGSRVRARGSVGLSGWPRPGRMGTRGLWRSGGQGVLALSCPGLRWMVLGTERASADREEGKQCWEFDSEWAW